MLHFLLEQAVFSSSLLEALDELLVDSLEVLSDVEVDSEYSRQ